MAVLSLGTAASFDVRASARDQCVDVPSHACSLSMPSLMDAKFCSALGLLVSYMTLAPTLPPAKGG